MIRPSRLRRCLEVRMALLGLGIGMGEFCVSVFPGLVFCGGWADSMGWV